LGRLIFPSKISASAFGTVVVAQGSER
jgi:hypothetical protein